MRLVGAHLVLRGVTGTIRDVHMDGAQNKTLIVTTGYCILFLGVHMIDLVKSFFRENSNWTVQVVNLSLHSPRFLYTDNFGTYTLSAILK